MSEKLRSGVNGKVREAIEQSIARILVGADGSPTIEAKPGGLFGLEKNLTEFATGQVERLIEPTTLSVGSRQWRLTVAP